MIAIAGPSYTLSTRNADIQRAVNLYLAGMEVPGKAPFILDSIDGLSQFCSLSGEIRGSIETNSRAFVVAGSSLIEIFEDGTSTVRGSLITSTGPVSIAYGLFQVVIVDGENLYVLTLSTNVFVQVASSGFTGASTVDFIDNYFIFTKDRSGEQFQITAINDATTIDALDFASAESSPDDIVGHIVLQMGLWLFGTLSGELFVNTGAADFPFERSRGSGFQVGLMACHSLRQIDNGCMWLGRDKLGSGIVYRLVGGQPQRVSNQAVEQALQESTDLTQARGRVYQKKGLTFYCLYAPGLKANWCYEVSTGTWHEECELDEVGQFKSHRGIVGLFAFGKHLVGGSDGILWEQRSDVYTLGSDPLVRERTTPHEAVPGRMRLFFTRFYLDCTTGEANQGDDPQVELSWSNDSGKSWSNRVLRSLGKVGEVFPRLLWSRLGFSRDRVWRIRFSGNAPFGIVDGGSDAEQGNG